jgi:hypothetical protein
MVRSKITARLANGSADAATWSKLINVICQEHEFQNCLTFIDQELAINVDNLQHSIFEEFCRTDADCDSFRHTYLQREFMWGNSTLTKRCIVNLPANFWDELETCRMQVYSDMAKVGELDRWQMVRWLQYYNLDFKPIIKY